MGNIQVTDFDRLETSDLIIDALYKGGNSGNAGDDPISKLIGTGNMGGFRYVGSLSKKISLCVLYSSLVDTDWPDLLNPETGLFYYYGDNKNPGHELHDTKKKGNEILRIVFDAVHTENRKEVPPFFIFTKAPEGRDVYFRGLAVPGSNSMGVAEDLVAIWKTKNTQRFQNYRSVFSILDEPLIKREWIDDIHNGTTLSINAPLSWVKWVTNGSINSLISPRVIEHRTRDEQISRDPNQRNMIEEIITYFGEHPRGAFAFEECAAKVAQMMDSKIRSYDLTRPWRDGGRDAIGKFCIGNDETGINVDFALEAKCYQQKNGCGVRDTTRLISRLKYRQFGIFVTTSYVSLQAYKEIIEDHHPVMVLAGGDIARILIENGIRTPLEVRDWLENMFS